MSGEDKPLVTFALFAYNQEKYIREAVEGGLAQDYEPLEIIISDDGSDDRTPSVIRDVVSGYRGPHKIIVNVNEENIGIGAHVNRIFEIASGNLVVFAAGDDVSRPNRTTALVEEWIRSGKSAGVIHSGYYDMTEEGVIVACASRDIGVSVRPEMCIKQNVLNGCTEAWSRALYDYFGPLHPAVVHEDRVAALRASLFGGIHYVNRPLVAYRRGGISAVDRSGRKQARLRNSHRYAVDVAHMICDIELAKKKMLISDDETILYLSVACDRLSRELLLLRAKSLFRLPLEFFKDIQRVFMRFVFSVYKFSSR